MKRSLTNSILSLGLVLSTGMLAGSDAAFADDRAAMKHDSTTDANDPESNVKRAADVYRNVIKEAKVPSSVLKNSKCVAVFPNVISAALAVGGFHGDGVAYCRSASTNEWGSPIFLDLNGASIGLQAGVKSTDIVLYMTGEDTKKAIEKGTFRLGGEVSAVAGKFDETFSAPNKGVVAYSFTEGVFAGASVSAADVSRDDDEMKAFYGTESKDNLFDRKVPAKVEQSVGELRKMLPS